MGKTKKKKEPFDPHNMTPEEQLKYEIACEIGLDQKILQGGWRCLTSKESGKLGGLIAGKKRQIKKESLQSDTCQKP